MELIYYILPIKNEEIFSFFTIVILFKLKNTSTIQAGFSVIYGPYIKYVQEGEGERVVGEIL